MPGLMADFFGRIDAIGPARRRLRRVPGPVSLMPAHR
jgi:hypothetical protein